MRHVLTDDARTIVYCIASARGAELAAELLPRCTGLPPARLAEALLSIRAVGWLEPARLPSVAKLTPWAKAWASHERPTLAVDSIGWADLLPDRRYPDDQPHVVSALPDPWRELHAQDCCCAACARDVSATRPAPKGDCAVCGGKPTKGWVCLGCHRKSAAEPIVLSRQRGRSRARAALRGGLG